MRPEAATKPWVAYPPAFFSLSLLLMLALDYLIPRPFLIHGSVRYVGIVLMGMGLGIVFWARSLFTKVGTTVKPFQESSELVVKGPFNVTRNPMYLSMVVFLLGLGILLGSFTPFLVIPIFIWIITQRFIRVEERMLEQRFGASYLAYRARVRRWI